MFFSSSSSSKYTSEKCCVNVSSFLSSRIHIFLLHWQSAREEKEDDEKIERREEVVNPFFACKVSKYIFEYNTHCCGCLSIASTTLLQERRKKKKDTRKRTSYKGRKSVASESDAQSVRVVLSMVFFPCNTNVNSSRVVTWKTISTGQEFFFSRYCFTKWSRVSETKLTLRVSQSYLDKKTINLTTISNATVVVDDVIHHLSRY